MTKTKAAESEDTGMGFKNKQKALDTLKALDGRDIAYQYHVITSFVSRAKRTLQITRDEEKLANLRDALKLFEDWLADYRENNRGKENLAYLPIETVRAYLVLAKKFGVYEDDFYKAYTDVKGDYKTLRSAKDPNSKTTWDIERNRRLREIIEKIKAEYVQWYETDIGDFRGLPTKEHVRCILLAYSPDPTKLKKLSGQVEEKFGSEMDEDNEIEVEETKKGIKRDHEKSDSEEDEPSKKISKTEEEKCEKTVKEDNGLGFKDREKALHSIKLLEERDVTYQYHAISGLVKRAERVISCTKDKQKIQNIKEAVEVLEKWITDYNVNGRAKENFNYLSIDVVRAFKPLADVYNIQYHDFLTAYEEVDGDYKRLRSLQVPNTDTTWDIERNRKLRTIVNEVKEKGTAWYESDGKLRELPSEEHTRCIMWAFSHDLTKLRKLLPDLSDKLNP